MKVNATLVVSVFALLALVAIGSHSVGLVRIQWSGSVSQSTRDSFRSIYEPKSNSNSGSGQHVDASGHVNPNDPAVSSPGHIAGPSDSALDPSASNSDTLGIKKLLSVTGTASSPQSSTQITANTTTSPASLFPVISADRRLASVTLPGSDTLEFVVFGDFGFATPEQRQVANYLGTIARERRSQFVVTVGDNIYHDLIPAYTLSGYAPDDPFYFRRVFEEMYADQSLIDIPWYLALGNHDADRPNLVEAEIAYTEQSRRWTMPADYFRVVYTVGSSIRVHFIVLNTMGIVCGGPHPHEGSCGWAMQAMFTSGGRRAQLDWLEESLKLARAENAWTFVVGHYPIVSGMGHDIPHDMIETVRPLLVKYGAHAYFSGHDHTLQHNWRPDEGAFPQYFISGGGGYWLHAQPRGLLPHELPFTSRLARPCYGIMTATLEATRLRISAHCANEGIVYETVIDKNTGIVS